MYTVIVDNIKKNEFNVLGLLCTVLYGKKKWAISYTKKRQLMHMIKLSLICNEMHELLPKQTAYSVLHTKTLQ